MRIGILGSGLMGGKLGTIFARAAGDVIWCPPGVRHWHGATPTTAMTHIAIQEASNGKVVDWMEKVSDQEYRR